MLLVNFKEEENLTGVALLTDIGFDKYLFLTTYYLFLTTYHGTMMEKEKQLFFLSEIPIYLR